MAYQKQLNLNAVAEPQDSDKSGKISLNSSYTIAELVQIVRDRPAEYFSNRPVFSSPDLVRNYLKAVYNSLEYEVFIVLYLDQKHRLIAMEEEFKGTLGSCSVYPREIVKQALRYNAAACIFAHNHPSQDPTPSEADKAITTRLKEALNIIDTRVIDHLITGSYVYSFVENGFL